MINPEKLFPNQEKDEIVFLLIRKHWFNYIIFLFLDLLMALPIVALILYSSSNPDFLNSDLMSLLVAILTALVLFILATQLYGFVDYYLDVYIVTDQRIVDISQEGFFKRQISELHLHQVQDVNASVDGFWGTILHFGDVHIQTAAERENFIFKSIPHPYNVAKQILDLHEKQIEKISGKSETEHRVGKRSGTGDEDSGLPYGTMEPRHNKAEIIEGHNGLIPNNSAKEELKPTAMEPIVLTVPENKSITTRELADAQGELMEGRETIL